MISEKTHTAFDVAKIRADFPILSRKVNGKPLVYFDSGATSQKPRQVIDSVFKYYTEQNANIHRGVHTLSQEITVEYENARSVVQKAINARDSKEIIFTKGTTESINLVASSIGERLSSGDEILVSEMEHHSNILPWQQLSERKKLALKVIPINDKGELVLEELKKLLTDKTRVVALTHVSNTLGTINPIKEIISLIRKRLLPFGGVGGGQGTAILIDGAQAIPHMKVDVQDLDADFYCFSGHKMYAPTGIGVLYGKEAVLNNLPNYQVGGGTIKTVSFKKTEYAGLPLRFEAGTPHIEGTIGLGEAFKYLNSIGLDKIASYEHELTRYAHQELSKIPGLRIIGEADNKASVVSFVVGKHHPYDLGVILDQLGIAVRTGHHCTQPLMERYGIAGTIRASIAFYNTKQEIDELASGVKRAVKMLG